MSCVKIDKSSGYIEYDDNNIVWKANIFFYISSRSIIIDGTTRALTDTERNNIITEILNQYAFGKYINNEKYVWLCKLKNRGNEKHEDNNLSDNKSYSIIGEEVLQLPKHENDSEFVKCLRTLYLNLKLQGEELFKKIENKETIDEKDTYIIFDFFGSRLDFIEFKTIILDIKEEIEDALSKYLKHNVKIDISYEKQKTKRNKSKWAVFKISIKEAN